MSNQVLFTRWYVMALAMFTVATALLVTGGASFLLENDATGISFLIIGVFFCFTGYYGYRLYRGTGLGQGVMEYGESLSTSLGLLGTVIGLIMMVKGAFSNIDVSDQESVKTALLAMSSGIGSALVTTLVGLISAVLIGVQRKVVEIKWA